MSEERSSSLLLHRNASLEQENRQTRERLCEIEEEHNNLANLYVASTQLHSTLDPGEVLRVVIEIVINLIGAEVFAIYLLDGDDTLEVVASEGIAADELPGCRLGTGEVGRAAATIETTCLDREDAGDSARPLVIVPLHVDRRPIGAIAIFRLLRQKDAFTALDRELFDVLGGHAATALFAARVHARSARKLHRIQGLPDLLAR